MAQLSSNGTQSAPLRVHALWGGIKERQHETKMKDRGQCGTLPPKGKHTPENDSIKMPKASIHRDRCERNSNCEQYGQTDKPSFH